MKVKTYMYRSKVVTLMQEDYGYIFLILDKCTKKSCVSTPYETLDDCEKWSYKVVKSF